MYFICVYIYIYIDIYRYIYIDIYVCMYVCMSLWQRPYSPYSIFVLSKSHLNNVYK